MSVSSDLKFQVSHLMYKGVDICQMIIINTKPGVHKLVWARTPFDELVVGQLPNPCFHTEYGSPIGGEKPPHDTEGDAQRAVMAAFEEHYRLKHFPGALQKP